MGFLSSIFGSSKRRGDGDESQRYITETGFRQNLATQTTTSPQTIAQLRNFGVTADTNLKLEFFFYTDTEAKAQGLAKSLGDLNYEVENKPSAGEDRQYVVTGWTTPIKMRDNEVRAWTEKMCRLGYEHDCEFDGWGTYAKPLGQERKSGLDLVSQSLALLNAAAGTPDQLIADCTDMLAIEQQDKKLAAMTYSLRGAAHLKNRDWQQAATDCTEALQRDPGLAEAFATRGAAHLELGQFDRAIADCSDALRLKHRFASTYVIRGTALLRKGEYDGAIADLSEAVRLEPESAATFSNRASAYVAKGACANAIADCNEALRLNPKSVAAYLTRGSAHARMGDYHRAIEDESEAMRLDPTNASSYYNRSIHLAKLGEYGRALADLSEALRQDPSNVKAYNNAAWYMATCPESAFRDGGKAVAYATRACELAGWSQPIYLGTLAAACAEAGEFGEATKWQEKALEFPDYARKNGEEARIRLALYKEGKPYRLS